MCKGMGPGNLQWIEAEKAYAVLSDPKKRERLEREMLDQVLNRASGTGTGALSAAFKEVLAPLSRGEFHPSTFDMGAFGEPPINLAEVLVRTDELVDRGLILAGLKVLVEGIVTFRDLEPDWIPRSLLKAGKLFGVEMENRERAVHFLRKVIEVAPLTPEAIVAERELEKWDALPQPSLKVGKVLRDLGKSVLEVACPHCQKGTLTSGGEWFLCPNCGEKGGIPPEVDSDT